MKLQIFQTFSQNFILFIKRKAPFPLSFPINITKTKKIIIDKKMSTVYKYYE